MKLNLSTSIDTFTCLEIHKKGEDYHVKIFYIEDEQVTGSINKVCYIRIEKFNVFKDAIMFCQNHIKEVTKWIDKK